jgi:hypothetical protein
MQSSGSDGTLSWIGNFRIGQAISRSGRLKKGIPTWLISVAATVILPLFPAYVDAIKHADWNAQPETYYTTAAVMAVLFGFGSDLNLFRFCYILIFLGIIGLEFQPQRDPMYEKWAVIFMIAVAMLHAIERFRWHVVLDREFPDWLKGDPRKTGEEQA